jgi:hypothetical protein
MLFLLVAKVINEVIARFIPHTSTYKSHTFLT